MWKTPFVDDWPNGKPKDFHIYYMLVYPRLISNELKCNVGNPKINLPFGG
jgi:hypothetical protein